MIVYKERDREDKKEELDRTAKMMYTEMSLHVQRKLEGIKKKDAKRNTQR